MNRVENRRGKQQGISFIGFILLMVLVGIVALLAMKLVPVYVDNYKLKAALTSVAKEPGARNFSREEIISRLNKKLYIDFGSDIVDLRRDLVVKRTQTSRTASIDYEVVVPLVYNLSALVVFDNSVELK